MKKSSTAILLIVILFASFISINNSFLKKPSEFDNSLLFHNGILGKNLVKNNSADSSEIVDELVIQDEEPIFWDLDNGANITYNPVVLFVNYYYWDDLPFYDSEEEYIFEMHADEDVIFNLSYDYSKYNEFYWYLGYDWNISDYDSGTALNLTVFFYQETDINVNHTAWISVSIEDLKETPTVDFNEFTISLFHWPDSQLTSGYRYYDPDGYNAYYHFKIYEDGYVTLKYADHEIYDSKELSSSDAQELLQELIDLGFYQLKNYYFSPGYDDIWDYYYESFYQIAIDSAETDEWRQCEESDDFIVRPVQYNRCLQAIKDRVDYLYFTPLRWRWDLFFIITGSSLGGLGVVFSAIYLLVFRRRR
ncbi:MAG: hypothetical protein FK733_10450 [Asgard group archaeon]|nr:hypothetical protein [Asgard group archaeon]